VVSAEAQQGVFLDVGLVERLPETSVLRALGSTQWMAGEVVRDGLAELIGLASDADERLAVTQARELVEYAIGTGTGVAVVPPTGNR
jgi:hypothetical protein